MDKLEIYLKARGGNEDAALKNSAFAKSFEAESK